MNGKRLTLGVLVALVAIVAFGGTQEKQGESPSRRPFSPVSLWRLLASPCFKTLQGRIQVTVFLPEGSRSWTMELWADENRSRVQVNFPSPEGIRQIITISTPDGHWVFLPFAKRVLRYEAGVLPSWRQMWQIRVDKLDMAKSNYTLKVLGRDQVAGHFCLVVQLEPKAKGNAIRKIWLRLPSGVPLQAERYSPDGRLEVRMTFTEVKIDEPLPVLIFDTTVPADWTEQRVPFQRRRVDISQASEILGFVPLLPTWLPPGYVLEGLFVLGEQRWKMAHIVYTDGASVISLFQHPAPAKESQKGRAPRGPHRRQREALPFHRMFPQHFVIRNIGNLRVVLISDVAHEWLERMANSLVPVAAAR